MAILTSSHNGGLNTVAAIRRPNTLTSTTIDAILAISVFQRLLTRTTVFTLLKIASFTTFAASTVRHFLINASCVGQFAACLTASVLQQTLIPAMYYGVFASRSLLSLASTLIRLASGEAYKRTETLRRKLFFEFMVWILNPYAVYLFIFWPGWVVIGALWVGFLLFGE